MPDVYKQSFKQNYTNNIELSIFNCGLERCAPGQTWGPGIRDHYLIHLVVSGKGIFEVGGRTWEVSEGDLFFARPSQLIRYTADEQQPWDGGVAVPVYRCLDAGDQRRQAPHGLLLQPVCAERHQVHPVQLLPRHLH